MWVIVIWYDGNYNKATKCMTENPADTDPKSFGLPDDAMIIAVIDCLDRDLVHVWIEGDEVDLNA